MYGGWKYVPYIVKISPGVHRLLSDVWRKAKQNTILARTSNFFIFYNFRTFSYMGNIIKYSIDCMHTESDATLLFETALNICVWWCLTSLYFWCAHLIRQDKTSVGEALLGHTKLNQPLRIRCRCFYRMTVITPYHTKWPYRKFGPISSMGAGRIISKLISL